MKTKIEWLNDGERPGYSFNPVAGCQKVSPGCKNCYAERMAKRLGGENRPDVMPYSAYKEVCQWDGTVRWIPGVLEKIDKIKKPSRIFLCSMADLGHINMEGDWIVDIYKCIIRNSQHTFFILTKRPQTLIYPKEVISNLFIGVTAENQQEFNRRIKYLKEIKEAGYKVFISLEPFLSQIDLGDAVDWLDWVIVGGETGAGKRYNEEAWFVDISEQCKGKTAYFFKSFGDKDEGLIYSDYTRREFPGDRETNINVVHDLAMQVCDLADQLKRADEPPLRVRKVFQAALILEMIAIDMILEKVGRLQPSYSVLCRSAATIAIDANDKEAFDMLCSEGLKDNPPPEIAQEIKDLKWAE